MTVAALFARQATASDRARCRMASNITRTQTPEDRELAAKNADLAALEIQLAQRELDVATLRVELHGFEQRYLRTVGVKFAEIDDLEAQIASRVGL